MSESERERERERVDWSFYQFHNRRERYSNFCVYHMRTPDFFKSHVFFKAMVFLVGNELAAFKPSKHNQKSKNAEDGPRKLEERGDEAGALEGKEEEGEEEEEEEEEESSEESLLPPAEIIPVPPMRICMLIVGTRGDVQPFVALGAYVLESIRAHDFANRILITAMDFLSPLVGR